MVEISLNDLEANKRANEDEKEYLKEKIKQETRDQIVAFLEKTRDRYEKDYNIYKDSDSKIISNFIKEIIKQIKEGDYETKRSCGK